MSVLPGQSARAGHSRCAFMMRRAPPHSIACIPPSQAKGDRTSIHRYTAPTNGGTELLKLRTALVPPPPPAVPAPPGGDRGAAEGAALWRRSCRRLHLRFLRQRQRPAARPAVGAAQPGDRGVLRRVVALPTCAVCVQTHVEARRCARAHVNDWDRRMTVNMASGVRYGVGW